MMHSERRACRSRVVELSKWDLPLDRMRTAVQHRLDHFQSLQRAVVLQQLAHCSQMNHLLVAEHRRASQFLCTESFLHRQKMFLQQETDANTHLVECQRHHWEITRVGSSHVFISDMSSCNGWRRAQRRLATNQLLQKITGDRSRRRQPAELRPPHAQRQHHAPINYSTEAMNVEALHQALSVSGVNIGAQSHTKKSHPAVAGITTTGTESGTWSASVPCAR